MVFLDVECGIVIECGYEMMFMFIKDMFVDCNEVIEVKEIEDFYCFGSYDFSI